MQILAELRPAGSRYAKSATLPMRPRGCAPTLPTTWHYQRRPEAAAESGGYVREWRLGIVTRVTAWRPAGLGVLHDSWAGVMRVVHDALVALAPAICPSG